MGSQKIARLNKVTAMLEGRSWTHRKLPLEVAKARVRLKDPGVEITQTLKCLNQGNGKEALAYFICDNFLTPIVVKWFTQKKSSQPDQNEAGELVKE
ncbi:MAG: hypothetical protein DSZ27_04305 [Thiomicrospira sp.]|nr:MAG: hypothetical protein DSZ27_04305 [Thiomicrospira sp.]